MDNHIKCKLLNIEYDKIEQVYKIKSNNDFSLSTCQNKQKKFKMIFTLKENQKTIHVQFIIYTSFIKSIEYVEKNQIKKITNIHPDGFLVSFDFFNENDKIELIFYPVNNNIIGKIFVKNIKMNIYDISQLVKIYWDNIFIINLKRRTDRKKNIIEKFKLHNISKYEFIVAVDGIKSKIFNKFIKLKNNHKTHIESSGHFACLLSHIKAISIAKLRGYSNIMILEDDVDLCDNFINKITSINIPQYDMIYLGGIINKKKIFFSNWAINTKNILGAYGYIIKSCLFDYILYELKKMVDCIDIFYMKNIQLNYNIILLDDMVKTNLDSTDTSKKSLMMIQRLSYIK